ncbi:MAG: DUF3142 domain-containing protein [Pseudomonas sp.]|uniref:DUF3142 domain-containing protein n=1 Tax=Pseudomonas sp. TaxID=306 RepID=UPI00273439E2|nr:DUF3142 domain-containing protein [Pseudomonas sp.]MDP3846247.1 DUF3142 domain-containing protein [Pseudomonas sp.]
MRCRYTLGLLLLLSLSGCEPAPPKVFDQQLYIWQRQWRPAHAEALAQTRAQFSTLRVLALQAQPKEGWTRARIDPAMLKADGRPIIAVVRLDGQLPQLDSAAIHGKIQQLLSDWQAAGLSVVGLEIDHDCASARLPAYAELLTTLRQALPPQLKLSITALPAWLESPQLESLLTRVDSSVLQVHAVSRPTQGLFAPQSALRWAHAYAARSPKPFYLALPAYGVGLIESTAGAPLVESEAALNTRAPRRELQADPEQVASLIQVLQTDPPENLAGLIWFRLPLAGDRRAWPLRTLQAVASGQPLSADLRLAINRTGALSELVLHNHGNLSGALPARIELSTQHCDSADALGGYRLQRSANRLVWLRQSPGQLAAGQQLALGWARCQIIEQGEVGVKP